MLRLIDRVRSPDGLQDGSMRQYATGLLRHEYQQVELLRCQTDCFRTTPHSVPMPIDGEIAANNDVVSGRGRLAAPQRDPQTGHQLFGAKRLGDVVIGTGIERADLLWFGAARGENDDWRHSTVANQSTDFNAVDVR